MRSFLSWVGGKRLLSKRIVPLIPPHTCYCEPFAGAGWVFFSHERSKVEVLNDKDGELVNLYLCVREHHEELLRQLRYVYASRKVFALFQANPGMTDIQRAARWFFVVKQAFGANVAHKPAFGTSAKGRPHYNPETVQRVFDEVAVRLARVLIENLDFVEVLNRYDRPETFFYCDPPYLGVTDYRVSFKPLDHVRLAEALRSVSGKWVLSYNAVPQIREMYADFHVEEVDALWTVGKRKQRVQELLIANYPIAKQLQKTIREARMRHG